MKGKEHTERDFELWRELDGFADLDYATSGCVVKEAFEVQDEHRGKRLDKDLLACFARAGGADLYSLWLRNMRQSILDSVH